MKLTADYLCAPRNKQAATWGRGALLPKYRDSHTPWHVLVKIGQQPLKTFETIAVDDKEF